MCSKCGLLFHNCSRSRIVRVSIVLNPSSLLPVQKVSYKNTTGVDSTYLLSVRGREGRNGGPPPEVKIPEKQILVKAGAAAIISVIFAMGEEGTGGVVSVGVRNCAEDGREDVLKFDVKPSQ